MYIIATEPLPEAHLPAGLWPVYVTGGLGVACILFLLMLGAHFPLRRRLGRHFTRRLGAVAGLLLATAVSFYVYADYRYHECIEDGNHPWWAAHFADGGGVCDRAVIGEVLTRRDE